MLEAKRFEDQLRALYHFFVDAENNNEEVTYNQIQGWFPGRRYEVINWYANNFWTWFLRKKEMRGRYRIFICRGMAKYPEEYFVKAHQKRQGKFFYHFGRALEDSRERAEKRKLLREQGNVLQPDVLEQPQEVEQDYPEKISFANNEAEEIDLLEDTSLDETSTEDGVGSTLVPLSTSPSLMERITTMFGGLSKQDRETIKQVVAAQETLNQQMQHVLLGQSQQATFLP